MSSGAAMNKFATGLLMVVALLAAGFFGTVYFFPEKVVDVYRERLQLF